MHVWASNWGFFCCFLTRVGRCANNIAAFTWGPLQTQSVFVRLQTYCEEPISEKPQPRGCRQTPGTIRHSRAYLFNRMCYSITASLSQQQSFKYPFVFGIFNLGASQDNRGPFTCLDLQRGLSLWFTDTQDMFRFTSVSGISGASGVLNSRFL